MNYTTSRAVAALRELVEQIEAGTVEVEDSVVTRNELLTSDGLPRFHLRIDMKLLQGRADK